MWDIQSIIAIDSTLSQIEKRKEIPKEVKSSYSRVLDDVRNERIQGNDFRGHILNIVKFISDN